MHTAIFKVASSRDTETGADLNRSETQAALRGAIAHPAQIVGVFGGPASTAISIGAGAGTAAAQQKAINDRYRALAKKDPEALERIDNMTRREIKNEQGDSDSMGQALGRYMKAAPYQTEEGIKGGLKGFGAGIGLGGLLGAGVGAIASKGKSLKRSVATNASQGAAFGGALGGAGGSLVGAVEGTRRGWDAARKDEMIAEALKGE